jgi:hypothetical protein
MVQLYGMDVFPESLLPDGLLQPLQGSNVDVTVDRYSCFQKVYENHALAVPKHCCHDFLCRSRSLKIF